tara:strand:- start:2569 stop:4446 length:1878 start_codon:yes stop_codon:yes gene_type:complete
MFRHITTPIFYPNANPHLGHAYTSIFADVFCRYIRLNGQEVLMTTGTDEHAEKIEKIAMVEKLKAEDFVKKMRPKWHELMRHLNIDDHQFIHTDDPEHHQDVKRLFLKLKAKNQVKKGIYEGWYNVREARFVPELEAKKSNYLDPDTGDDLEKVKEDAWFFPLSEWAPKVASFIQDNPNFINPPGRRKEILARLNGEVEDLCISRPRSRLNFAVPIPDDAENVFYVWFDALTTYLSGVNWDKDDQWEDRWKNSFHLLAKDILWFHAGVWPALLMAAELPLPKGMFVHGYLTVGNTKMSKSLGNVIDPLKITRKTGLNEEDSLRFFCLYSVPFGSDGAVTVEQFFNFYNSFLANEIGNLIHRSLSMIDRYLDCSVKPAGSISKTYLSKKTNCIKEWHAGFESLNPRNSMEAILDLVRWGHKYLDEKQPWNLYKNKKHQEVNDVFFHLCDAILTIGNMLNPLLPASSDSILKIFNSQPTMPTDDNEFVPPVKDLKSFKQLFPRIDIKEKNHKESKMNQKTENIDIKSFFKTKLKIGTITSGKKHPDADRLLVFKVDLGEDSDRQIVAGLAGHYTVDEMIGKQVVVVANLEPVKLRGEMSEGMILCADDGGPIALHPQKQVSNGTIVK